MRRSARISRTSQPDRMMRETRQKSRRTPKPIAPDVETGAALSVGGVRITEMNRDTLRKHVRGMRLKPKGPLKADLQRCLCDHLRKSSCVDGINKGGDSGPLESAEGGSTAKEGEGRFGDGAGDGMDVAGAEVEDGNSNAAESVESDKKVANEPSPDCVLFRGTRVSGMQRGTMSEILEYLNVSSGNGDGDEMAHNLVKALLMRRTEATVINRKQRWKGGLVSKMNKTQLTGALRSFGAEETGKVVVLRARLHKLVRRWAAVEILVTTNVGGGSVNSERCSHRYGSEGASGEEGRGNVVGGGDKSTPRREDSAPTPAGGSDGAFVTPAATSPEAAANGTVEEALASSTSLAGCVLISAHDDGERNVEFGFPTRRKQLVPAAAAKRFTFTRCIRTKRGRSSVDDDSSLEAFVPNEDDVSGVFEFATVQSASGRRVRPRGLKRNVKEVMVTGAPSITRESSTLPPQASSAKGFDMSRFKKPGEWKCETCFVRNPPEQQACLSCEAAKPVAGEGYAAGSRASDLLPVPTPIIGGALFAGGVPSSNHTFMFGSSTAREMFKERKEKLHAEDDGERNVEFGFPTRRKQLVPAAAAKRFTFTRCIRTKRGRSSVDDDSSLEAFVPNADDVSAVFEFATVQSASGRRVRPRGLKRNVKEVMVTGAPSITRESSTLPPQASSAKGFDMSRFKKPGEWKCETCLVQNPPEQQACLSCEAVKPVAGQGDTAAPSSSQAPSHGTGSSVGRHARGSARMGNRGLKPPNSHDRYRPLVFTPRRMKRPTFPGSNGRDESIVEWLNSPVDDAKATVHGDIDA